MFNMWGENWYRFASALAAAFAGEAQPGETDSEGPEPRMAPALERASFMTL